MKYDKILSAVQSGQTKFGDVRVTIDTGGIGGRYRAFIQTPTYTTMVETPDMVDKEGPLTFYKRLAQKLIEIV